MLPVGFWDRYCSFLATGIRAPICNSVNKKGFNNNDSQRSGEIKFSGKEDGEGVTSIWW